MILSGSSLSWFKKYFGKGIKLACPNDLKTVYAVLQIVEAVGVGGSGENRLLLIRLKGIDNFLLFIGKIEHKRLFLAGANAI
jgi:hypothetical protein